MGVWTEAGGQTRSARDRTRFHLFSHIEPPHLVAVVELEEDAWSRMRARVTLTAAMAEWRGRASNWTTAVARRWQRAGRDRDGTRGDVYCVRCPQMLHVQQVAAVVRGQHGCLKGLARAGVSAALVLQADNCLVDHGHVHVRDVVLAVVSRA